MKIIISQNLRKIITSQQAVEEDYLHLNEDINEDLDETMENQLQTITPESLEEMQQEEDEDASVNETPDIEEPKEYPQFNTPFQAMRWGKHNNETIRINYRTLHGTHIVRDIEPHGEFYAKTTHRTNFAVWDKTIGGIRTYIMENIVKDADFPKGFKFTGEKFAPKFNFSKERRNLKRRVRRKRNLKRVNYLS